MIHQLLTLTRPLFVLDVETTGLDPSTARIVEVGFQQWTAEGLKKEWRSLVDPGIPIPPNASKIHGITDASMRLCRRCQAPLDKHPIGKADEDIDAACIDPTPVPTFKQLAPNLAIGFKDCDYAGKNVRFDLRMLDAEMARAGVAWSYAGARIVDAERLEQLGEPRSLSDLYRKHLGKGIDGAHQALNDVRATTEVIAAQLAKYRVLPRDLNLLHKAQWGDLLDAEGKFRMENGVAICCFGKHRGKAMKDIEQSYWDWIIGANFPADVKALAADAKLGKFPEGWHDDRQERGIEHERRKAGDAQ